MTGTRTLFLNLIILIKTLQKKKKTGGKEQECVLCKNNDALVSRTAIMLTVLNIKTASKKD